jgi:hypothetical protein
LRPNRSDQDTRAADSDGFGMHLGPGYLHRVVNPGHAPLDITARSLLLRAGLAPQVVFRLDRGYIEKLGLTKNELTTCMYLLCYFNAANQTIAVQNMCSVTNRTVFLFNGLGAVASANLIYDQAAILAAFPNCHIDVIDAQTHRIRMQ